jgi:hypothetical protein
MKRFRYGIAVIMVAAGLLAASGTAGAAPVTPAASGPQYVAQVYATSLWNYGSHGPCKLPCRGTGQLPEFTGNSNTLSQAEATAYGECMTVARKYPKQYRGDCKSQGLWERNGYYALAIAEPFASAYGFGVAPTSANARSIALAWCQYYASTPPPSKANYCIGAEYGGANIVKGVPFAWGTWQAR